MSTFDAQIKKQESECRISEILQWTCNLEKAKSADETNAIHCYPVPRIFRLCPGRPAIEITHHVIIDTETGEVDVPPKAQQVLPKGKAWWDVIRKIRTQEGSQCHQAAKPNPAT